MADYVLIKSGSESPVVTGEFRDGAGNRLDLTGKTVTFTMRPWNDAAYIVNAQTATIDGDPTLGEAFYPLSESETVAGHHLGEWLVNPGELRLPVAGHVHILIEPKL